MSSALSVLDDKNLGLSLEFQSLGLGLGLKIKNPGLGVKVISFSFKKFVFDELTVAQIRLVKHTFFIECQFLRFFPQIHGEMCPSALLLKSVNQNIENCGSKCQLSLS